MKGVGLGLEKGKGTSMGRNLIIKQNRYIVADIFYNTLRPRDLIRARFEKK